MHAQFAVFTNRWNKGLISVDRRTSLLSYVQYLVQVKVVYNGFITLSARKANSFGVGPKPIATRVAIGLSHTCFRGQGHGW